MTIRLLYLIVVLLCFFAKTNAAELARLKPCEKIQLFHSGLNAFNEDNFEQAANCFITCYNLAGHCLAKALSGTMLKAMASKGNIPEHLQKNVLEILQEHKKADLSSFSLLCT